MITNDSNEKIYIEHLVNHRNEEKKTWKFDFKFVKELNQRRIMNFKK